MKDREADAIAEVLAGHFGWRPYGEMARNRSDLRTTFRAAGKSTPAFDINEPTQDDCVEAAYAVLKALAALREIARP